MDHYALSGREPLKFLYAADSILREDQALAEWEAEVERLLREGKKLHAMKRHREIVGLSLKEAIEAIEAIEARLSAVPSRPAANELRSHRSLWKGWLAAAVACVLILWLLWRG
ncbi:hypothetical protein POL68_11665 [Stigmatella sp. ncwal1]|uniref:Uncharacterized protein n=1 Tax=Stigmatella ashevillensis TaxID=2995309 RepID=A0ABT5D652_9BACT|nr:hypothetical protein [Stigmatella ashevillena]MDC0709121.1 hypothetical protein [Stigmatella ashevillena]